MHNVTCTTSSLGEIVTNPVRPFVFKLWDSLKWKKPRFLTCKLYLGLKGRNIALENIAVNKGIFPFLGARIWGPIPVYRYEIRLGTSLILSFSKLPSLHNSAKLCKFFLCFCFFGVYDNIYFLNDFPYPITKLDT